MKEAEGIEKNKRIRRQKERRKGESEGSKESRRITE